MGVAECGAFMNAAGQVAVNSAPYVAGYCFFNALENALRYRQPTKVLQLGAGGDTDVGSAPMAAEANMAYGRGVAATARLAYIRAHETPDCSAP